VASVTAGEFIVGGLGGEAAKTSAVKSHVSSFELGIFEVTVGRFKKFLKAYDAWRASGAPQAGAGSHPLIPGSGWDPEWLRHPGDAPDRYGLPVTSADMEAEVIDCVNTPLATKLDLQPRNCVSFYEAAAFCIWDGGRLPTDLEWEYAAAGGDENRIYPWGTPAPVPARAAYGCNGVWPDYPCQIPVVGSSPAGQGRFGQLDLAGSVEEWTFDAFDTVATDSRPIPCNDCASVKQNHENNPRVMHGGDWTAGADSLRVAARYPGEARFPLPMFGFRCAYDAP